MFRGPSQIFESGRLTLSDVREMLGVPSGRLGVVGGPPGCPGVVGGPPGCLEVVWMPSRMSTSGREAFPDVWEWSDVWKGLSTTPRHLGGPPGCSVVVGGTYRCPGAVGRPSRMSGGGCEVHLDVRQV